MKFVANISNDDVAALEAVHFDGHIEVVETVDALAKACTVLAKESIIGFDTETRPSFKAGVTNKVALIQLSTKDRCYLIRLNKLALSREILAILSSDTIKKVGADVRNDLTALNRLRHFTPRGFIDLQTEVPKYGIEDKSLRKISGIVLGKKVSKAQRLSNWEAKQLTPQQQMYAATDAWVCVEIYNRLTNSNL
jgi:ribonuclease D